MNCPNCGDPIEKGMALCENCGRAVSSNLLPPSAEAGGLRPVAFLRHDLVLRRASAALVIVDVQERLVREVVRHDEVVRKVSNLAEAASVLGVPVLVTEHASKTFGATAPAIAAKLAGATAVQKVIFSCFSVDEFREKAASLGRRQLIVAGLETHICVCQTVLDGIAAGYSVHVARDACSARSEADHAVGLEKMAMAGAVPCSTEMAIFELLEKAGTDEFRRLLPLIKGR